MSSEDSDDSSSCSPNPRRRSIIDSDQERDNDGGGGTSDISNDSFSILDNFVEEEEEAAEVADRGKGPAAASATAVDATTRESSELESDMEDGDNDDSSTMNNPGEMSFSQKETIIEIDSDTDYFEASQNIKIEPQDDEQQQHQQQQEQQQQGDPMDVNEVDILKSSEEEEDCEPATFLDTIKSPTHSKYFLVSSMHSYGND